MDKLVKAIQRIARDWDDGEIFIAIVLTLILFPWSLIFWAVRIIQEYEP